LTSCISVSVDFLSEVSCAKSKYFDPINTSLNYFPLLMGHPVYISQLVSIEKLCQSGYHDQLFSIGKKGSAKFLGSLENNKLQFFRKFFNIKWL